MTMNQFARYAGGLTAATAITLGCGVTLAAQNNVYVAVDSLETIAFGSYAGQSNPNQGRLTFLFAHWNNVNPSSNHFHGIGVHTYSGPVPDHVPVGTNANNRIPETFTGQEPLTLQTGHGLYSGKLMSMESGEAYSDLTLYSIHDLAMFGEGEPETIMYNSSSMRYNSASLDGLDLAIEIVSITPGLHLSAGGELSGLSQPGDLLHIGTESDLPLLPVFWTDENAPLGIYSAELKLIDLSGTFEDSGTFNVDFAVIPEPATVAILGAGLATLLRRRR